MKNIFVALALFFALGASAQVKKTPAKATPAKAVTPAKELTNVESAQKDFEALNAFINVADESSKANLIKAFETKHSAAGLSQERKDIVSQYVISRLEELLGAEGFAKLKTNKKLFSKLTK